MGEVRLSCPAVHSCSAVLINSAPVMSYHGVPQTGTESTRTSSLPRRGRHFGKPLDQEIDVGGGPHDLVTVAGYPVGPAAHEIMRMQIRFFRVGQGRCGVSMSRRNEHPFRIQTGDVQLFSQTIQNEATDGHQVA